jgi:hypothetical protein
MKMARYLVCTLLFALIAFPFAAPRAAQRCYPTARFAVLGGGLVRDTLTKLVWQQQASPATMNSADAANYCSSSGFRLPTVKELRSLVDHTVTSGPTIDQVAFAGTPASAFWTSSRYVSSSSNVWGVHFGDGTSTDLGAGDLHWVRCVR